jgi:hypothetical protein
LTLASEPDDRDEKHEEENGNDSNEEDEDHEDPGDVAEVMTRFESRYGFSVSSMHPSSSTALQSR